MSAHSESVGTAAPPSASGAKAIASSLARLGPMLVITPVVVLMHAFSSIPVKSYNYFQGFGG